MPIRPTVNLPNRTPVLGLPSTFLFKDLEREINKVLNSETPQKDDAIKELIDAYVSGKEQKGKSKIEQRLKCCLKFLTRKDCVGKVSRDMLKTICSDCNKNKISIGKQKKELANTLSEFCTITQNLMRLNQVKLKVSLKLKVSPSSRLQKERNKKEVLLDKAIKDLKNKSRLKERELDRLQVSLSEEVKDFEEKYGHDKVVKLFKEIQKKVETGQKKHKISAAEKLIIDEAAHNFTQLDLG